MHHDLNLEEGLAQKPGTHCLRAFCEHKRVSPQPHAARLEAVAIEADGSAVQGEEASGFR